MVVHENEHGKYTFCGCGMVVYETDKGWKDGRCIRHIGREYRANKPKKKTRGYSVYRAETGEYQGR